MKEVKNKNIGNTGILIILSVLLALSGMAAMASANGYSSPPNQFYGIVTVDGEDAPVGTTINAYMNDALKESIELTTAGKFGYDLKYLNVEGNNGDVIDFKINDGDVVYSTPWEAYATPLGLHLSTDGESGPIGDAPDDGTPPGGSSPNPGRSSGSGSSPASLPADGAATTAPGDGDGLTPESESHEPTGADAPDGADSGAKPATDDEPGSTGFLTGSGATALAAVGLLVLIALIAFVIKRRT